MTGPAGPLCTTGLVVPGMPQPLLAADACPQWAHVRAGFDAARAHLAALEPELLVLYSTRWPSVIGHQIQADPEPVWTHVDEEFHDLGSISYRLRIDADFAATWRDCAAARGLHARTVAYHGFPIDTGSVVALELLDPARSIPACIVSCNMYADRGETLVLGKATADAIRLTGKRAVAVAVTALSNRMFTAPIEPEADRISSLKDDEWNRKILEFLGQGRLEDVSQLAREFARQANADSKLKALWWLGAVLGQDNAYEGEVYAYGPIWGTGAAVVRLERSERAVADKEFDEEDVEVFVGDREVLGASDVAPAGADVPEQQAPPPSAAGAIATDAAPTPVGAYPHARRVGDMLYLSGVGPRRPGSGDIPGGPVRGDDGAPCDYDITAQTRQVIDNVEAILEAAGASLTDVVDVTAFLIDMDRDFAAYNEVYAERLGAIGPTRTTLAVRALPTPIAVEFKVIARAPAP